MGSATLLVTNLLITMEKNVESGCVTLVGWSRSHWFKPVYRWVTNAFGYYVNYASCTCVSVSVRRRVQTCPVPLNQIAMIDLSKFCVKMVHQVYRRYVINCEVLIDIHSLVASELYRFANYSWNNLVNSFSLIFCIVQDVSPKKFFQVSNQHRNHWAIALKLGFRQFFTSNEVNILDRKSLLYVKICQTQL